MLIVATSRIYSGSAEEKTSDMSGTKFDSRAESHPYTVMFAMMAAAILVAVLVWQAVTSSGSPDPLESGISTSASMINVSILVFREGLEFILVLAAITADMVGRSAIYRRPLFVGVGLGLAATLLTGAIAAAALDDLATYVPMLHLQAATGLVAVIVLVVVMNWFFHKMYWTGWISLHTKRKSALLTAARNHRTSRRQLLFGLALLGFSSVYREGFEVVLFLQSYRLRLGPPPVFYGIAFGLFWTVLVAIATFVLHRRLPYKRMLVFTGAMLTVVLTVMVGEQAQEMQLAGWLPTTQVAWFVDRIPAWMGVWFAIFPTWETLSAQTLAVGIVVCSYLAAERRVYTRPKQTHTQPTETEARKYS